MFIVGDVGVIAVAVVIASHRSDIIICKGAPTVVEVIVVLVSVANVDDGVIIVLTRLPPKNVCELADEDGVRVRRSRNSKE